MVVPHFIFKNKDSRDFNIIVNELPPQQTVDNEVEFIEIPGRDGYLTISKDRKPALEKQIIISIPPNSSIASIKKWLNDSGRLILFNDPEVFYNARIQTIRELEEVDKYGPVSLNFMCQPYGYLHNGDNSITINTKNTILNNPTNEIAKPILKIYGSGTVDLIINSKIHKFDINQYVEVDSELMESYKDISLTVFTGDFPQFYPGPNNITWDGTVTKIEVIPRWRR